MKKYILEIIVFICGAMVMIFELAGSRVLAPYFGTSLIVWTSLIGVILGSLSLGYWLGGKIADKKADYGIFSFLIFFSGLLIAVITVFKTPILIFLQGSIGDIRISGTIASLLLFSPGSIFLGMISPYAIRLKLETIDTSGATVGRLYAISTVGSIVGTFLAGFYLIPFLGTTAIFYFIAFILIAISFAVSIPVFLKVKVLFVAALVFYVFFSSFVLAEKEGAEVIRIETNYNSIRIFEGIDPTTERPIRILNTDPYGIQGGVFIDKDDDLIFEYLKYYRLANFFVSNLKESLVIGGGVYSLPKDYIKRNPDAHIDVVEIDPKLTELARKYFNFNDDPRIAIYHEDGRTFLNKASPNYYDCIFLDAFNSHLTIPFHLTTKEVAKSVYNSLNDEGIVMANIISSVTGEMGKFLRAEYLTYKEIFPQVYLFLVKGKEGSEKQNIMLVAIKSDKIYELSSDNEEYSKYFKNLWTGEIINDVPILTDDFAPVDYYTLKIVN